jgi:hypothetical protein
MEPKTTTPAVPEPSRKTERYSLETLETASKAIAVLLVGTYVLGFMIVSLHNASHGFFEVNPLRPRILAAGFLFLFTTLLPAFLANQMYSRDSELTPKQQLSHAIVATLAYYFVCVVLTFMLGGLLSFPSGTASNPVAHPTGLGSWLSAGLPVGMLLLVYGLRLAWRTFRTHPMRTALFAGLDVLVLLSANLFLMGRVRPLAATMWFFVVGVVGTPLKNDLMDPGKRKEYSILLLAIGIVALTTFSSWVYPQFRFSWGGGSPIPVVVYFSGNSRLLPGQQLDADILDESDSGFYIVQRNQTQAIFIPRSAVATIYFSDKPLDPALLNDPQKQPPK